MDQPSKRVERDLRSMIGDGIAFSTMVGLGETYVPAFALAAGHGDLAAGLVATLPMLAGAVLQLATPVGVRRLGSYRAWVVTCARLQAASLLPLAVWALLGRIPLPWLFVAASAYWGFGMSTMPAWNAWVGALVPSYLRARFFARRTRFAQAALFAALVAAGAILQRGSPRLGGTAAFAILFACAALARLVSARFLARQSEPEGLAASHRTLPLAQIRSALRGREAKRVLLYLLGMQVAVQISAPYFTPFMLGPLALPYASFTALIAMSFVARIAVLPWLGRLARARGAGRMLRIGAVAIVPLPPLWLVSDSLPYLLALQACAGVAWATLELATLLAFFEGLDPEERTSVLTVYNLASAAALATGALFGAALFRGVGGGTAGFATLFTVSALGRLLTLPLLARVGGGGRAPEGLVLPTVAVRPSIGAVQRPVLPEAGAAGGEPADPFRPR
jgi:MFS family permease